MSNTKEWVHDAIVLAETGALSWRGIARELDLPKSTVSDALREYYKMRDKVDDDTESVKRVDNMYEQAPAVADKEHDNSRILFLSDLHFPYHHKNTFEFLQMLKDRYQPTRIIGLGDELDHHAMSFHDSDPDLFSAGDEGKFALKYSKRLGDMFPEVSL